MNGVLERTLGILELLSQHGEGMELAAIADQLNIPRSAVHRLLADLVRLGYVRQTRGPQVVHLLARDERLVACRHGRRQPARPRAQSRDHPPGC